MGSPIHLDMPHFPRLRRFTTPPNPYFVGATFVALIVVQGFGFLVLGTGRAGQCVSRLALVLHILLALVCVRCAARRSEGVARIFLSLATAVLLIWLGLNSLRAYDVLSNHVTLSDSMFRMLYRLYGVPILMMFFLPEDDQQDWFKSEILLDLFQVTLIVSLAFFTFLYLPLQQMSPQEALVRITTIGNLQNLFLLVAIFVRLQFACLRTRDLFLRLWLFMLLDTVVTFIGNPIDLHHSLYAPWFDLGWALPYAAGGLLALTWTPPTDLHSTPAPPSLLRFLRANLVLVAVLFGIHALEDRWENAHGQLFVNVAIAASLLAFIFRLALTQYHQQLEITQRKAAQDELSAANETISGLLEEARVQTLEISQIAELGNLLQACSSRDEAFRVIAERLPRLLPRTSGALSVLRASRNRAESVAEWGPCPPADHIFAPDECWALRRGCSHALPAGHSVLRCSHLRCNGSSLCIPLIAHGEAIGVLALQDEEQSADAPPSFGGLAHRNQLVATVVEHVALAISNLNLRDALRLQAVRDPLTGLYNRRYMQEFLEREIQRARRRQHPVSVMMLDLDNFKRYNDTFGHSAGDDALRIVGETLLHSVRSEDLASRHGGEEFVVILPECSLQQAIARAEEICRHLRERRVEQGGEVRDFVTVSIGVAAFDETTDREELLLKFADQALYQAKHEGRNRVVAARPAAAAVSSGPLS